MPLNCVTSACEIPLIKGMCGIQRIACCVIIVAYLVMSLGLGVICLPCSVNLLFLTSRRDVSGTNICTWLMYIRNKKHDYYTNYLVTIWSCFSRRPASMCDSTISGPVSRCSSMRDSTNITTMRTASTLHVASWHCWIWSLVEMVVEGAIIPLQLLIQVLGGNASYVMCFASLVYDIVSVCWSYCWTCLDNWFHVFSIAGVRYCFCYLNSLLDMW